MGRLREGIIGISAPNPIRSERAAHGTSALVHRARGLVGRAGDAAGPGVGVLNAQRGIRCTERGVGPVLVQTCPGIRPGPARDAWSSDLGGRLVAQGGRWPGFVGFRRFAGLSDSGRAGDRGDWLALECEKPLAQQSLDIAVADRALPGEDRLVTLGRGEPAKERTRHLSAAATRPRHRSVDAGRCRGDRPRAAGPLGP